VIDQLPFKLPAEYGKGVFRRKIRLTRETDFILGELEDDFHAFKVKVYFDTMSITAIESEAVRFPLSTCSEASKPLLQLIGTPLTKSSRLASVLADPRTNCTHLFDLVGLSVAHTQREEKERLYEVSVPDVINGKTCLAICCNGREVLSLETEDGVVTQPRFYQGQNIARGFSRWILDNLSGDEQEAALILHRARFVSLARMANLDEVQESNDAPGRALPLGVCYTYSENVFQRAKRNLGSSRDFTGAQEELLKFISYNPKSNF